MLYYKYNYKYRHSISKCNVKTKYNTNSNSNNTTKSKFYNYTNIRTINLWHWLSPSLNLITELAWNLKLRPLKPAQVLSYFMNGISIRKI